MVNKKVAFTLISFFYLSLIFGQTYGFDRSFGLLVGGLNNQDTQFNRGTEDYTLNRTITLQFTPFFTHQFVKNKHWEVRYLADFRHIRDQIIEKKGSSFEEDKTTALYVSVGVAWRYNFSYPKERLTLFIDWANRINGQLTPNLSNRLGLSSRIGLGIRFSLNHRFDLEGIITNRLLRVFANHRIQGVTFGIGGRYRFQSKI